MKKNGSSARREPDSAGVGLPPCAVPRWSPSGRFLQGLLSRYRPTRAMVLDNFERFVVLLLFAYFALHMLTATMATHGLLTIFLIVSESLPVVFILRRRKLNAQSNNTIDWMLGLFGASLPLLVFPSDTDSILPQQLCSGIMLAGLYVQISAKLILGRSFGIVAANRGIKVGGPYRFIRHPIYAGYTVTHVGFLLAFPSVWNTVLYSIQLAIQITRLMREEALLKQDRTYRDYAARVRYRLVPMIF